MKKEILKRISVLDDNGIVICNFIYSQTEINRYKKYYYSLYRKTYKLSYVDYLTYMNYLRHIDDVEVEALCDMDTILRRFNWFNEKYHLDEHKIHDTINFIQGSVISFMYTYEGKTYVFKMNISTGKPFHDVEDRPVKGTTYKRKVFLDYPTWYVKQKDLMIV